jgi:small subunit ribosomal protein S6
VESDGETVVELERQMRLSEDVIRFLTVRLEEVTEAPSPMMSRRDRDDRRRPREDRPNDDAPRETSKVKEAEDEPVAEAAPAEETA